MSDILFYIVLIIFAAVLALAWLIARNRAGNRAADLIASLEQVTKEVTRRHRSTLIRKKQQLISYDDYGNADGQKWFDELGYFFRNVILKERPSFEAEFSEIEQTARKYFSRIVDPEELWKAIPGWIEAELEQGAITVPASAPVPNNPQVFEQFCADKLRSCGWSAQLTKASGDQGADIIARFREQKAVIQCKLYSAPVGNKAVQEIVAAKALHGADFACVVSNQSYTKSAQELARANRVQLLHYEDLDFLSNRLNIPS